MSAGQETPSDYQGQPGHWRLVIALMLIYSYAFVDRVVLALLVDPIKNDLNATDFQMSLLLGLAFAFFYGIFSIPAGHFVDRMNRRRLIFFASIGWALMTVVCGTATSMTQLFIGRAGVGIMEAMVTPAAFSLIRDAVPARSRGLAFSTYAMGPIIGGALSLAGGGVLLKLAGDGAFSGLPLLGGLAPWQATLIVVGLLGLPLSLLLLTFKEPVREHDVSQAKSGMVSGLIEACRFIAANRAIYTPLLIFTAVGAMMSFSYNTWFPTALGRRYAMAPEEVGPILGGLKLLAGFAGLMFGGWMMNRLIRRNVSVMSYAMIAVIGTAFGIGGACIAGSPMAAWILAAVGIFFLGISQPAGATQLSQSTPAEMIGRVSAVYLLIQTLLGQTLGPLAVAIAGEQIFVGPSSIAYGLTTVQIACALVAAICCVFMVRHVRRISVAAVA